MWPTFSSIEDTDSTVPSVVNLVVSQHGVTVRLDPHPSHGVVEYLIVLDHAQPAVVDQNPAILTSPDLVTPYQWIAPRSERKQFIQVEKPFMTNSKFWEQEWRGRYNGPLHNI